MKIATWDLETTGFSPTRDRIVEVGFVESEGTKVVDQAGCLIKPGIPIPKGATSVHGITDKDVRDNGFPWSVAGPRFYDRLMAADYWCGFNLRFDLSFLRAALNGIGIKMEERPVVDPFWIAQRFIPEDKLRKKNLTSVANFFGVSLNEAHRAVNDSMATLQLLEKMMEDLDLEFEDLVKPKVIKLGKYHVGEDPMEALYSGLRKNFK